MKALFPPVGSGLAALGVIAALASLPAPAQTGTDAIEWQASRPLVWSDFRGPVDSQAAELTAAITAASISLGYEFEMRRNGRCVFEITSVATTALFHPDRSWVRDRGRTEIVLEHEQGHFDLTQVFRAILEREAADLIGDARRCPRGGSMQAVEARAGELVRDVREPIFAELERVQAQYDAETGHGTRPELQREWTARIREALRSGRW